MFSLRRNIDVQTLHIFTLCSLAIAHPLLAELSRRAEFFIARGSLPLDIFSLVLILCIVIPVVLILVEILAGAVAPTLRSGIHFLWIFLLVSLFLLLILKQYTVLSGILALTAGLLPAALIAIVYRRFTAMRSFFSFLSPAVILVPSLFLLHPSVRELVHSQETALSYAKVNAKTPIIMIVFDALPVLSLMDEDRTIDAVRYPNFARLLEDATWYRNTSTVASVTNLAVPAILTGNYPKRGQLPTLEDHPNNLFTFLGGSYELNVFESGTRLCPRSLNAYKVEQKDFFNRTEALLVDLSAVYLHLVLPPKFDDWVPSVTETWGNFWGGRRHRLRSIEEPLHLFEKFLATLKATEKPTLYYLHLLMPHPPYKYLPSGKEYNTYSSTIRITGARKGVWSDDEWAVQQGLQRHLLQLGYTDRLLGKVLDRLKETSLFEKSLIVVTADHGVSFWPGAGTRKFREFNCLDLMFVPLFIKAPYQTEGNIIDQKFRTIDILPTIADFLENPLPWKTEGFAFNSTEFQPRRRQFTTREGVVRNAECDITDRSVTLERKLSWFGSKTDNHRLFSIGPHPEIIGIRVRDLTTVDGSDAWVELTDAVLFQAVDPNSNFLPAHIAGWIRVSHSPQTRLKLAIAVNGIVKAVIRTYYAEEKKEKFAAIVPESSFRSGQNDLQIFVVQEQDNKLTLLRARIQKPETYPKRRFFRWIFRS